MGAYADREPIPYSYVGYTARCPISGRLTDPVGPFWLPGEAGERAGPRLGLGLTRYQGWRGSSLCLQPRR